MIGSACRWVKVTVAPSIGAAWLNTFAAVMLAAVCVMLFWMVQPCPIRGLEVVSVDPESRVIDRRTSGYVVIVRRVDMSRNADIRIVRQWIDEGRGIHSTVDDWLHLKRGNETQPPLRVFVPAALPDGLYKYRAYLEWCNPLKCVRAHQSDIDFTLTGRPKP